MSVSWGPRPSSQSCRLASVSGHHAEAWAGRPARAILARPALLRRRQFGGPQDAAHGLAADREVLFAAKFFRQMGIVETLILAAGQAQDQLLLGNGNRPRHAASAIAMLYPGYGVGAVAPLQPLHLALAQLQRAGGFAYAQPPARCILNHFHPLELFLTHGHHPYRVTKSRCSYGVTLSWSIYRLDRRSFRHDVSVNQTRRFDSRKTYRSFISSRLK